MKTPKTNTADRRSAAAPGSPRIPERFYKAALPKPVVYTVGELKAALAELPDDLPCECGFNHSMELVVYNHGTDTEHLEIREGDDK